MSDKTSSPWIERTEYTECYCRVIKLSGTGEDETDYIIPLKLHYGAASGEDTVDDVFLNSCCETDFSDVYFTDVGANRIQHYVHSHGNYEIINDSSHLGNVNIITAGGKIVASGVPGVTDGIAESDDNGETWDILNNTAGKIIWVDPITDLYFAIFGYLFKRSDAAHTTWATVIDMTAVSGIITPYGMAEDAAGTLFVGRYQTPLGALIWRSLDGGATWEVIYDNALLQHIHGIDIDPYTGYLYAGVDGDRQLVRSVNATDIAVDHDDVDFTELIGSDAVQMIFGDGWRMFSNETPVYSGTTPISTVFRTTDDVNFTSEILTGQAGRVIRQVGISIYLTCSAQAFTRYPQIFRRNDDGTWKTIWADPYDTGVSNTGVRVADEQGTPTGSENQLIIGNDATPKYGLRLFDGGSHYQALVYVKIPTLPAAGVSIRICYGGIAISESISSVYPANLTQTGLLAHYKLDEGTGTALTDSSGNGKSAVLVPGTGNWNSTSGRKIGQNIPDMLLAGASYHFNGDGYIEITGSGIDADFQFTNNFTVTIWFRATGHARQIIIGKGPNGGEHWAIELWAGDTPPCFWYSATDYKFAHWVNIADGGLHFVGVSISDDDKITWCVDGESAAAVALAQPIVATNSPIRIGADSAGARPFTGDTDDAQIYTPALPSIQMRQIYESRYLAATEPVIDHG